MYMKNSGKWVPDNLSELKKLLKRRKINVYGLPMVHNFYAGENKYSHDWDIEPFLTGKNNLHHAFRIIVGTSWNWIIANLAGYQVSKYDLGGTITSKCYAISKKNKNVSSTHWHDILNVDEFNPNYRKFLYINQQLINIWEHQFNSPFELVGTLRKFFSDNIAEFAVNDKALTMFIPLDIQKKYKTEFKKDAVKQYKAEHQTDFYCYIDLTTDLYSYMVRYKTDKLKECCWLSPKTLQRILSCAGKTRKYTKKQETTTVSKREAPGTVGVVESEVEVT